MAQKFFKCNHCGNFVGSVRLSGVPIVCCGEPMTEVKPENNGDAKKHIPVVTRSFDTVSVSVGEIPHVMTDSHYIDWIYLETMRGGQMKRCVNGPSAVFNVDGDIPIAVYAYCNLHGLWMTEL